MGRSNDSPLGRLGTLLASGSRTAEERRLVWEALERVAESSRPAQLWLGYGPDSLMYVLPPAVSPELVRLTPEQIFDRAHNVLWEWWVSAGLVGVAAFLAVFMAAITAGYRLLGLVKNRLEAMGLLAAQLAAGVVLVAIPIAAGQRELAAVGLPAGLVAGAALYAAAWGWRRGRAEEPGPNGAGSRAVGSSVRSWPPRPPTWSKARSASRAPPKTSYTGCAWARSPVSPWPIIGSERAPSLAAK